MRVGIDYRPALVNREGIGRYTRELVRALIELSFGGNLGLFGYTLAGRRFSLEELGLVQSRAELVRLRVPSRVVPWLLRKLGKGVDDLVGGAQLYHHTQYNRLPVRQALEVTTIHDCMYMSPGYVDDDAAQRMTQQARELAQHARGILVPSEYVGAEVVLRLGAWPNRISVVGHGCDHVARYAQAATAPRPAAGPYILTVSRVDARKNHTRMLHAFERLVREGSPRRWIVAGARGFGYGEFEQALAASPVRERVEWRESVPEDELFALYAGADLMFFASLNEGFGLPPLEAMASGTAVLASAVTAMPEVCGDAALLVDPHAEESIFEGLRLVLGDDELRAELVRKGHARARRFTWRETARKTLLAYQRALQPEEDDGPVLRRSL